MLAQSHNNLQLLDLIRKVKPRPNCATCATEVAQHHRSHIIAHLSEPKIQGLGVR